MNKERVFIKRWELDDLLGVFGEKFVEEWLDGRELVIEYY